MNLIKYYVCVMLMIPVNAYSQAKLEINNNPYSLQYGFSLKGTLEFGYSATDPHPICKLSGNFGVGSNFINSWIYPSLNIEVDLYNGGLGSRSEKDFFRSFKDMDLTAAITLTAGTKNHLENSRITGLADRNIPLYYFADFVYPALQNPFDLSLSIGTDIIFPVNKEKKRQRIGFINAHVNKVQVSYFNDGGVPISGTYLGDRKDRNYTGGGVVSFHGKPHTALSLVELSYYKFTGYTKNAFEVSNLLYLSYMNYHKPEQRKYNKSIWGVNVGNPTMGWSVKVNSYNKIKWDMQHDIHWSLFNSYHMVPYDAYWTISGSFYKSINKLGLQ